MPLAYLIEFSLSSGIPLGILVVVTLIVILRKLHRIYCEVKTSQRTSEADDTQD